MPAPLLNCGYGVLFLQLCQFQYFVNGCAEPVGILTASLGEVGLTTTATLDKLGGFTNHLTGIQSVVADHVVAHHDRELGFAVVVSTQYTE